jgi:hypothetical protein
MELVIDAQVVCSYFKETVLELDTWLTERAERIFERVGDEDQAFLDDRGMIEYEWREIEDREWFDVWYARLLQTGGAVQVPVQTCNALIRQLNGRGFPKGSRDIWYVRTAKAVVDEFDRAIILTEDLDFYDPTQKRATANRRKRVLLSGDGTIARYLDRNENITVKCVAAYLGFLGDE